VAQLSWQGNRAAGYVFWEQTDRRISRPACSCVSRQVGLAPGRGEHAQRVQLGSLLIRATTQWTSKCNLIAGGSGMRDCWCLLITGWKSSRSSSSL
jgi:hypothetical protein